MSDELELPKMKKGRHTTEYWLTLLAQVVGSLLAAGILPVGLPMKIAGGLMAIIPLALYILARKELKMQDLAAALELMKLGKESADNDRPALN